jgi:hypothetical protein
VLASKAGKSPHGANRDDWIANFIHLCGLTVRMDAASSVHAVGLSSTGALQLPSAVSALKPSKKAQEFRWKYLKEKQVHATPLHERPAPAADDSLEWREAGTFLAFDMW